LIYSTAVIVITKSCLSLKKAKSRDLAKIGQIPLNYLGELTLSVAYHDYSRTVLYCIVFNLSICIALLVWWTFQKRCKCARPH